MSRNETGLRVCRCGKGIFDFRSDGSPYLTCRLCRQIANYTKSIKAGRVARVPPAPRLPQRAPKCYGCKRDVELTKNACGQDIYLKGCAECRKKGRRYKGYVDEEDKTPLILRLRFPPLEDPFLNTRCASCRLVYPTVTFGFDGEKFGDCMECKGV